MPIMPMARGEKASKLPPSTRSMAAYATLYVIKAMRAAKRSCERLLSCRRQNVEARPAVISRKMN